MYLVLGTLVAGLNGGETREFGRVKSSRAAFVKQIATFVLQGSKGGTVFQNHPHGRGARVRAHHHIAVKLASGQFLARALEIDVR